METTSRQKMLQSLADDLNALGWSQPHKMWFVKGEATDEWLEQQGEFSGAPEKYLTNNDGLPDDAHGIVLATEGWDYPQRIKDGIKNDAQLASLWRTSPPDKHPERIEIRHLLFVAADGEVIGMTVDRAKPDHAKVAFVDQATGLVGDRTVDAARGMLGLNDPKYRQSVRDENLKVLGDIGDLLTRVAEGSASEQEVCREMFLALPDQLRASVLRSAPPEVLAEIRAALTEEERQKYGL